MPLLAGSWSNVDVSEEDGRTLEVEVHGAYDIANTQWIGKQDPYVIAVPMPSGLTQYPSSLSIVAGASARSDGGIGSLPPYAQTACHLFAWSFIPLKDDTNLACR